ncbi:MULTISPECIES: hypothetical protein [Rhodococcus]|uniref:hypothetical protein n=1 Tax=Rhodococcus TaxID=1827 RepID=UPI002952AAA3|nr:MULTISPECIES: hypothetical protein [Rhodococcus]MDV7241247.1 hypothetical protein [Rhodococcus oxybenzonivorans]MDV7273520.1 hypothetical protein [Rhodococcus oxybenzonivorans]MDV7332742.1 hypothetical protein [Rhodococcus oxybenzonivorans]MDV7341908.1 hypothetical protein [Rhodococcus oxybenzonivorans]MDV8026528.1 hypothetical protein [Rhodococcus sp. IEGM 27]
MLCSERRWCDIDYDLSIADSDRLLAEALTPRAVVSLVRVAIRAERGPSAGRVPSTRTELAAQTTGAEVDATQRSPPRG